MVSSAYFIKCVNPNGHSFLNCEIQNFAVVAKRPFLTLHWNTKFHSCTQTAIRFFAAKWKILKLRRRPFRFFLRNTKIVKTAPKRLFVFFYNETENIESCTQTYGSHLSHIFEKPSISIEKPSFSIE